jgi:peptidoglycan-associated lipoprotein
MRIVSVSFFATLFMAACATAPKPQPDPAPVQPTPAAPPPAAAAPAPAPAAQSDDIGSLLKGLAIHFDFDRADLTSDSQKRLDALADAMRTHKDVHIKVAGNCDELGTEEYNLALGQRRADAVKTYLGHLGVDHSRIDTVSYGKERPVDDRHTPEAWSANRRDDFDRAN